MFASSWCTYLKSPIYAKRMSLCDKCKWLIPLRSFCANVFCGKKMHLFEMLILPGKLNEFKKKYQHKKLKPQIANVFFCIHSFLFWNSYYSKTIVFLKMLENWQFIKLKFCFDWSIECGISAFLNIHTNVSFFFYLNHSFRC